MESRIMSKKKVYRPNNWSEYNKSLVRRGDLCLWISEGFCLSGIIPIVMVKKVGRSCIQTLRFCVHTKSGCSLD